MNNLPMQREEIIYGELIDTEFKKLDYINRQFSTLQSNFH